jgi:H+/Cl- antiporter ClcA
MKLNEQMNHLKCYFAPSLDNLVLLCKWLLTSVFIGLVVGGAGTFFYHAMSFVTTYRMAHTWLIYLLPFAGLLIIFLYSVSGQYNNKGTNLVLLAIQTEEHISIKVSPLIIISTLITHLFGGSAGREGAALQLGGSLGDFFSQVFHFDEKDKKITIMCAMSACFSAVFGTPMAAAIFSMEVISVGIMHYSALVPCVMASLTASMLARYFGALPESFTISLIPELTPLTIVQMIIAAALFAAVSVIFCVILHFAEHYYRKLIKNPYIRIFVGGVIVILLTLICRSYDYIGAGMPMIEKCFEEGVPVYAFILKMIFTAATLGAGYKGGEIVPSFFTGATFGYVIASLLGLPASLCAGCGMIGVFCGVTNCPISSLLMAFELFGFEGMPYYMITIAVCYMLSGYYGLYSSQKIVYSKTRTEYINTHTH